MSAFTQMAQVLTRADTQRFYKPEPLDEDAAAMIEWSDRAVAQLMAEWGEVE